MLYFFFKARNCSEFKFEACYEKNDMSTVWLASDLSKGHVMPFNTAR